MNSEASEYQQLREILISPEVSALHALEGDLDALREQLHNPERLSELLQPVVAAVLRHGDAALSLALIQAITPFLDRAVKDRALQDTASMADALAPTSTGAIALHYTEAPQAAARDIGPLVSAAIKEQIRGERDAMIDALYPVMGSTISKYLSHTLATLIRTINERIESHLSVKALTRKIRARILGVSEAELLLRESVFWSVDAAFLIHKASGLVIAQAQNPAGPELDPDLLSGMLTAIRTLFNESMMVNQEQKELDQIEYGESKIILEAAGYCYLAAVVRGLPDESCRKLLRETLTSIVETPGSAIEAYSGNPDAVPSSILDTVRDLVVRSGSRTDTRVQGRPYAAMITGAVVLLLCAVLLAVDLYRNGIDREMKSKLERAFLSAGPSPLAGVSADVDRDVVRLAGRTANEHLRARAESIARTVAPSAIIENGITVDPSPPIPILTESRVRSLVETLNGMDGVFLDTRTTDGNLEVTGWVADQSLLEKVERTFEEVPGLRAFTSRLKSGEPELPTRLFFDLNSVLIRPGDEQHLSSVVDYLHRFPSSSLRIIGHSDQIGAEQINRRIALGRATTAMAALRGMGVPGNLLRAEGTPLPPPGSSTTGPDSLGRCVRFLLERSHTPGMP